MSSRSLLLAVAFVAVLLAVACGNSTNSVNVSPAVADAQNFPNSMVQFSATANGGAPLSNATWCVGSASGICNGNIASIASVDNHGLAQCLPGAKAGTVTILAGTGAKITNPDGSYALAVFGSAQLTCP